MKIYYLMNPYDELFYYANNLTQFGLSFCTSDFLSPLYNLVYIQYVIYDLHDPYILFQDSGNLEI